MFLFYAVGQKVRENNQIDPIGPTKFKGYRYGSAAKRPLRGVVYHYL